MAFVDLERTRNVTLRDVFFGPYSLQVLPEFLCFVFHFSSIGAVVSYVIVAI